MFSSSSHALDGVRVGDCMHAGILSCDPEDAVNKAAAMMTDHRVHAIAVRGATGRPDLIVSDVDLMAAVGEGSGELSVGQIAVSEALSAPRTCLVREAAQLMAEHGVNHLIVHDEASGEPIGVLSTTDVLSAFSKDAPR